MEAFECSVLTMVPVASDLYFTKGLIGHLVTKQPGTIAANIGFQTFFFF